MYRSEENPETLLPVLHVVSRLTLMSAGNIQHTFFVNSSALCGDQSRIEGGLPCPKRWRVPAGARERADERRVGGAGVGRRKGSRLPPSLASLRGTFLRKGGSVGTLTQSSGAITRLTIAITLMRMFIEGPDVSLKGSPTVSPTTVAVCVSDPLPP